MTCPNNISQTTRGTHRVSLFMVSAEWNVSKHFSQINWSLIEFLTKQTMAGEREAVEIIQSWSSISNSFLSFHGTITAILCNARFFEKSLMKQAGNWVVKDSNCNIKFKSLLCKSIYWPLCCHFGFHLTRSSLGGCACSSSERVRISSSKPRFCLQIREFSLSIVCQLGGFERESTLSVNLLFISSSASFADQTRWHR